VRAGELERPGRAAGDELRPPRRAVLQRARPPAAREAPGADGRRAARRRVDRALRADAR
jgi:hypothetical protein